ILYTYLIRYRVDTFHIAKIKETIL
ncbi:hypothetical protein CP8484711_1330B, partial [Chlamydia psittaci 84-8471/1]